MRGREWEKNAPKKQFRTDPLNSCGHIRLQRSFAQAQTHQRKQAIATIDHVIPSEKRTPNMELRQEGYDGSDGSPGFSISATVRTFALLFEGVGITLSRNRFWTVACGVSRGPRLARSSFVFSRINSWSSLTSDTDCSWTPK